MMCCLEHWDFLLCCWPKTCLLQHIPDSLRSNGGGDSGIYESGGLDCIVKSPRADLTDNRLFITRRKLGRTTTRMIFLIPHHLLTNPANSTLPQTSPSFYLTMRIPLIEERNNRRALCSRDGFHGGGGQSRRWMNQVQHVKLIQTRSHDFVYAPTVHPCPVLGCNIENWKFYLRVKKLPQWLIILFDLLRNEFWSESHDFWFDR